MLHDLGYGVSVLGDAPLARIHAGELVDDVLHFEDRGVRRVLAQPLIEADP